MSDVFISYAKADNHSGAITSIFTQLTASHSPIQPDTYISAWFDEQGIRKGEHWSQEIDKGLEQAHTVAVFVSPSYFASEVCNRELSTAIEFGKKLIPIWIEPISASDVEIEINRRQSQGKEASTLSHAMQNYTRIRDKQAIRFDTDQSPQKSRTLRELIIAIFENAELDDLATKLLSRSLAKERGTGGWLIGEDLIQAEKWMLEASSTPNFTILDSIKSYIISSRKANTIRRRTIGVISVISLAILIVIAGIAIQQSTERARNEQIAKNNSMIASVRRTVVQATELLQSENHDVGLLLLIEALRISESLSDSSLVVEIKSDIFRSLQNNPFLTAFIHLPDSSHFVTALSYSSDGQILAASSTSGELTWVNVWNTNTLEMFISFPLELERVDFIQVSIDKQHIIVARIDQEWGRFESNPSSVSPINITQCRNNNSCSWQVWELSPSPRIINDGFGITIINNKIIVDDSSIQFPDIPAYIDNGICCMHDLYITSILGDYIFTGFGPDNSGGMRNGELYLQDRDGNIISTIQGESNNYVGAITDLQISPASEFAAFAWGGETNIWNIRNPATISSFRIPDPSGGFAFNPVENILAIGINSKIILIDFTENNTVIARRMPSIGTTSIGDVDISRIANRAAFYDATNAIVVLDISSNTQNFYFEASTARYVEVALNHDGSLLGVYKEDQSVKSISVFSIDENLDFSNFSTFQIDVQLEDFQFDSSSQNLLGITNDGLTLMWQLDGNMVNPTSASFTQASSDEFEISVTQLIDLETNVSLGPIYGRHFLDEILNIWYPDGEHILSIGNRGSLAVIVASSDKWIHDMCRIANRNLTIDEWDLYFDLFEYHQTCP